MGNITAYNKNLFKSSKFLFSRVKRLLQSYDLANRIDEGEFPQYVKEILNRLSVGVFRETQAILKVTDYKASLPDDYDRLYSIYRCKGETREEVQEQGGFKFVTDVTRQFILDTGGCEINPCENSKKLIEELNVKTYVIEEQTTHQMVFKDVTPLRLSPNVNRQKEFGDIHNKIHTPHIDEITIDGHHIHTNFDGDYIYMKYYGFPIDEDGQIEIPDIQQVEDALYWYIVYNILLSFWFDSSVPDIQNKWQKAELEYEKAFAEAKYYLKLPSFTQMVDALRKTRSQNKLVYLTSQHTNTNFQRN